MHGKPTTRPSTRCMVRGAPCAGAVVRGAPFAGHTTRCMVHGSAAIWDYISSSSILQESYQILYFLDLSMMQVRWCKWPQRDMVHHHIYGFSYAKYIASLLYTNMENGNLANIYRRKLAASLYLNPKHVSQVSWHFPLWILVSFEKQTAICCFDIRNLI